MIPLSDVYFKPSWYTLTKVDDPYFGYSGNRLYSLNSPEDKMYNSIRVGHSCRVGDFDSWWTTTPIVSITKVSPTEYTFITRSGTHYRLEIDR